MPNVTTKRRLHNHDIISETEHLVIQSALDDHSYPTGREVTAEQMERLALKQEKFHGEWNYTLRPSA